MKISPRNIIFHELIGLRVEIIDSSNKSQIGISGRVIDETANMLVIESDKGRKMVSKKDVVIVFYLPTGEKVKVEGKVIVGRPEERLKKKFRRW
ncbi:MAG: ribonuclease P protein component 1 [Thermoproteales archaeon]|nr:ribonuclease P protein component 1 [Thermoproteales archaeon]